MDGSHIRRWLCGANICALAWGLMAPPRGVGSPSDSFSMSLSELNATTCSDTLSQPSRAVSVFDLSLEELLNIEVSTASKIPEKRSKSSSNVFLITAADLKRIGARSYHDALTLVPGFTVFSERSLGRATPLRGIYTSGSPRVLILLNGREINPPRIGSASNQLQDNIPIESIQRIEIIKGPASALYGANAFLGVINIITKSADDIDGREMSISTEFETDNDVGQQYNFQYGKRFNEQLAFMFNLNLLDRSSPDVLAGPDSFGRTDYISADRNSWSLYSELEIGNLTLRGGYYDLRTDGGYGTLSIIEHQSEKETSGGTFEAEWSQDLNEDLHLKVLASVDHITTDNEYFTFIPGTVPPDSFMHPWNDTGLLANPVISETSFGQDIQLTYQGLKSHIVVAGIAYRYESQHDPSFNANFPPDLSAPKELSEEFNWMESAHRNIYSIYLQDLWDIRDSLRLTSGVRFDEFSDFGSTINPRLGLAWDISEQLDSKLSYGTGFRSPTFSNQYIKNNPLREGNPDLGPEEAESIEMSVGYMPHSAVYGRATYYHAQYDDLIADAPGGRSFKNVGEATVDGCELEGLYVLKNNGRIGAYYTYNRSIVGSGDDAPDVPHSTIGCTLNLPLSEHVNWNVNVYRQGETPRAAGDSRRAMSDHAIVNTTFLLRKITENFEMQFSIFNLLDEDYASPAPANSYPNDYTAPGRSFVINGKYRF